MYFHDSMDVSTSPVLRCAFGNADLRSSNVSDILIYTDILDVDLCSAQYTINILLNPVSSQCACVKSSLASKPEGHPQFFNG